jgi:hypothetical protein
MTLVYALATTYALLTAGICIYARYGKETD